MNEFQFCYWLMGVFELGEVKEHLNLVKVRQYTFCNWLDGFLEANESDCLSVKQTAKVLDKLRMEFYNVIDKSYPKDKWDALYAAHEGCEVPKVAPKDEPPKLKMLC